MKRPSPTSYCVPLFLLVLAFFGPSVRGQCLTAADREKIIRSIENPLITKENKKLRREILKMREERLKLNQNIVRNWEKNQKLIAEEIELGKDHLARLCEILKKNGWLDEMAIDQDGVEAVLFLIRNSRATELQRELFPVIVEASKKGLISKTNVASLVDIIRIAQKQTQIFGTQTHIIDELAYLYPLENESKVDEWRKLYGLIPLYDFIKEIEVRYQTPVLKTENPPPPVSSGKDETRSDRENLFEKEEKTLLDLPDETEEVVKIDTKLINLNVRVLDNNLNQPADLNLTKDDFSVLENGRQQEISFFSVTETPFDLILLLDLSGSTVERRDVIIKSARQFVEKARLTDRIGVVTFKDRAEIVADFTSDKELLYEKIKEIRGSGGSKIWDALQFTFDRMIGQTEPKRRTAIVFMTDGVDNSLTQIQYYPNGFPVLRGNFPGNASSPSKITFTELLETVRQGETPLFSVYLANETSSDEWTQKVYRQAKRTLQILSDETGGQFYFAKNVRDLEGIYGQVIDDLSKIYLISYQSNIEEDAAGSLRKINVQIKNRPNLIVKTKNGYYVN
ncbi:MAG: VWA domain-containing protein [Pyrinomonadaceae bacterium]